MSSGADLLRFLRRNLGLLGPLAGPAPLAAALFGSRAKGTASADSDFDLLLVTAQGPECSRILQLESLEAHVSYLPSERLAAEPPAKWWEPLASAQVLLPGPDDLLDRARERARRLWPDPAARRRAALPGARRVRERLALAAAEPASAPGEEPVRLARLRRIADGALSIACFLVGQAEPSKRRRASGLATALARSPAEAALPEYRRLLGLEAASSDVAALDHHATAAFAGYRAWIEGHESDPLLRSLLVGPNRWQVDLRGATLERREADVQAYLAFVLDRLLLDTRGPRSELLAQPWLRGLVARLYPPSSGGDSLADCSAVLESALPRPGLEGA